MFTKGQKILFCPLNWGLGHASRTIPLIHNALHSGCQVYIASDGVALDLLKAEFPKCSFITLPGYNINYQYESIFINIFLQLPKILFTSVKEKKLISSIVKDNKIDLVVSDNRFGCYSKFCKSVYITHQLHILHSWALISYLASLAHRILMSSYDEIWVPDSMGLENLGGKLSTTNTFLKNKLKYIGPLTRLKSEVSLGTNRPILVLLSGPEPQRTLLEHKIAKLLLPLAAKVFFIRGSKDDPMDFLANNYKFLNLANTLQVQSAISQAEWIICRSGYSTIMDLSIFDKKVVYIPTPGQTEQEYLGKYHADKNHKIICIEQQELDVRLLQVLGQNFG
jgi:uncharacterized protein (TIGR00661 family)